jgi:amino acid transporter
LNWIGVRAGSGTQKLTSFLKAIALLSFVIACFALGKRHGATNFGETMPTAPSSAFGLLFALVLSFQLILGAYGG